MSRSLLIAALAASSLHVAILAAVGAWRGEGSAGPGSAEPIRITFVAAHESETPSEAEAPMLQDLETATRDDPGLPEPLEGAGEPPDDPPLPTTADAESHFSAESHVSEDSRSPVESQPYEPPPVPVSGTMGDVADPAREAGVAQTVEMKRLEMPHGWAETAETVKHEVAQPPALVAALLAQIHQRASAQAAAPPPLNAATPCTGERTEPIVEHRPRPVYPGVARRRGYEGTVLLLVEVLADGRVGVVEVSRSSGHDALDRAARQTVRDRWRFRPGSVGGRAASSWIEIPIEFRLRD